MQDSAAGGSEDEATVVQVDARRVWVEHQQRVQPAILRGTLFEDLGHVKNPVAVGDRVRLAKDAEGLAVEAVLPRRNHLSRTASSHDPREQVLVANVDQLLVIGSVKKPGFSSNRTDRILAVCEWHEIPAVVVLNKADLVDEEALEVLEATYRSVPVSVLRTSAVSGLGVEQLGRLLHGKTSVLYGPSGAGKSSLINRLEPGLNLKEGRISRYWEQGRHTTTSSRLYRLKFGATVIDTPGVRLFRPYDVSRRELRDTFPDIVRISERCQFDDCSHDHEPGCALDGALDEGLLAPTRWASYLEMLDDLAGGSSADPEEEEGPVSR